MTSKKKDIPFCPICGKRDNVEEIEYFSSWKCDACHIAFEITKLAAGVVTINEPKQPKSPWVLRPARVRNLGEQFYNVGPIMGPAQILEHKNRIVIQQDENLIQMTGNVETFSKFLQSPGVQSKLSGSLHKNRIKGVGRINLD